MSIYSRYHDEVADTKTELKEYFSKKGNKTASTAEELVNLIENFIDAKIEYATRDLENKINKTGQYDPEY